MMKTNDKELNRLRTRIKEEFLIVRDLKNADIESAMINVDNLIEYLLERYDNKDCAVTVDKQPSPKPSDDGFAQS